MCNRPSNCLYTAVLALGRQDKAPQATCTNAHLSLYLFYIKLMSRVDKVAKAGCLEKLGLPKIIVYKSVRAFVLLQNGKYSKDNWPGIALSSFWNQLNTKVALQKNRHVSLVFFGVVYGGLLKITEPFIPCTKIIHLKQENYFPTLEILKNWFLKKLQCYSSVLQ